MNNSGPQVIRYHLLQGLLASIAEMNGDEVRAQRLRAEMRYRLINMSDDELWELARLTRRPEESLDSAYHRFKQVVEECRATASEWMKDLPPGKRPPD